MGQRVRGVLESSPRGGDLVYVERADGMASLALYGGFNAAGHTLSFGEGKRKTEERVAHAMIKRIVRIGWVEV